MKRFIFLTIILTFCSTSFALDNNVFSFRITPRVELVNGVINEYVFDASCKNVDNKESQLDWDVRNIPVFGINADFNLLKYINIGIDTSVGTPKKSGNMQDYDWLNFIFWKNEPHTELTNYSIHDNFLLEYKTFSASAGPNIKLPADITLTPKLSYYYEFISFDGKDGYCTYKSNNWEKEDFSGKVISYKQETNALLFGLSVTVETLPKAYFYADMFIPIIYLLNAVDYHYNRGLLFWDNCSQIFQLQTHTTAQYKFNKYHSVGLSTSLQYIPLSHGDTRSRLIDSEGNILSDEAASKLYGRPYTNEWSDPIKNGGGTGRLIWSIALNYSFSL